MITVQIPYDRRTVHQYLDELVTWVEVHCGNITDDVEQIFNWTWYWGVRGENNIVFMFADRFSKEAMEFKLKFV